MCNETVTRSENNPFSQRLNSTGFDVLTTNTSPLDLVPPGGLPVARSKTKPGLNRVKVIFHEEIKVAKRFRRKKKKKVKRVTASL